MSPLRQLVFIVLYVFAAHACACSCEAPSGTPEEAIKRNFESNDLVAVMEVVAIERKQVSFSWGKATDRWVRFEPQHIFKGLVYAGQQFYASLGGRGTDCEVKAKVGDLWIVYATETEPIPLTMCSPSGLLINRFRTLRLLFELSEPSAPGTGER